MNTTSSLVVFISERADVDALGADLASLEPGKQWYRKFKMDMRTFSPIRPSTICWAGSPKTVNG